jgi:hypothetical protein
MASTEPADALLSAERERDKLRERAAWWEDRKGAVMFPAMVLGLAGGYGVGFAINTAVALPGPAPWFGAVIGLLAVGRGVTAFFDPRKLVAAQKRVDALRARRDRDA